jgi:hypothetical protein
MAEARLLDYEGNWTAPFTIGSPTTCGNLTGLTHKLFGTVHPGDNAFQALTFCGRRALEVPGPGAVIDCPRCLAYIAEE